MYNTLNNLRGKYIKAVMAKLEKIRVISPEERKVILDGINDLMREVFKELGYETEEEKHE